MHPRNRHQGRYDLARLTRSCPELKPFVIQSPAGEPTIDFTNARGVRTLNRALLQDFYGLRTWDLPEGYLCPPIPGRSDYVHHVADLLATSSGFDGDEIPRGDAVRILDVGVGASAVYPIIGRGEYGWSFVGAEVDPVALASARKIVESNPTLAGGVELRLQKSASHILNGVILAGEKFAAVMCNPPFHASLAEAQAGNERKWKNLGREPAKGLNFGGQGGELWCPGGESAFVIRMITESVGFKEQARWFSALVSKATSLPTIERALEKARVSEMRQIEMAQGQKRSRIVAWTY